MSDNCPTERAIYIVGREKPEGGPGEVERSLRERRAEGRRTAAYRKRIHCTTTTRDAILTPVPI